MKISIEQLKIGDRLVSDIVNINGTKIAESGSVVDEIIIRRCKTWSIKSIEIEADKKDIGITSDLNSGDSALHGINPVMDKILTVAEKIKAQRINKMVAK